MSSDQPLPNIVEIFDSCTEQWEAKRTTGESPVPEVRGAACTSINNDLFMYGGWDGDGYVNSLYQLNTETYHWCKLGHKNEEQYCPIAKRGAAIVPCGHNLALYGGYGILYGSPQHESSFIKDPSFTNDGG